jgi:hypothetical protein
MSFSPTHRWSSRVVVVALVLVLGLVASASARADTSTNWSGYAVTGTGAFRSASATWVVPTARCTPGHATDASIWVGLGGYTDASQALEQAGTDVDCGVHGHAGYSAWYELWPADSVTVSLPVHPGDTITVTVAVAGTRVKIDLLDRTTGATAQHVASMPRPDVSYAEWIVEAPTVCDNDDTHCTQPPLTHFGTTTFTAATVTTATRTGTIADPAWTLSPITLDEPLSGTVARAARAVAVGAATPSALSADGASFAVRYHSAQPATRTLPARTPRRLR